jgi:hypothetical protein
LRDIIVKTQWKRREMGLIKGKMKKPVHLVRREPMKMINRGTVELPCVLKKEGVSLIEGAEALVLKQFPSAHP